MRLLPSIALALLAAGAASRSAAQISTCVGDCDGDGVVRISELLTAVNVTLGMQVLTSCAAADGDDDGAVEIAELIAAVLQALNGCQLSAEEAAEAAALIAQEIVDSVNVFDFGVVGASGGATAAHFAGLRGPGNVQIVAGALRGGTPPRSCQGGGTFNEECVSEGGSSRLTVDFAGCRLNVRKSSLVFDGRRVRTVADAAFCDTREVPEGVNVIDAFDRFREQVIDGKGTVVSELRATLTRSFEPSGIGCEGQMGTEVIDGVEQLRCTTSDLVPATFGCPDVGRDLTLTARDLTVVRGSQETELGCERRRTLLGSMFTDDAISGERFDATYNQLLVRQVELDNGRSAASLDGSAQINCLGDVAYATEVPLSRRSDDRCPNTGLLTIELPDGRSRVRFGPRDAITFDYEADGSFDVEFEVCEDAALARCR